MSRASIPIFVFAFIPVVYSLTANRLADGEHPLCARFKRFCAKTCTAEVWWLHIPKSGGFQDQVNKCNREKTRISDANHQLLAKDADDGVLGKVVAIFRQPEERLASVFDWIMDNRYCCLDDWGWQKDTYVAVKNNIIDYEVPAPEAVGRFQGCATNMILGKYGCMSEHQPEKEEIAEAIRRVGKFNVVGLTSEWYLTNCLYNFKTQGKRFVASWQLANTRPTHGSQRTAYNTTLMPKDPYDGELYQFAEQRFWDLVKENNISKESCPLKQEQSEHEEAALAWKGSEDWMNNWMTETTSVQNE